MLVRGNLQIKLHVNGPATNMPCYSIHPRDLEDELVNDILTHPQLGLLGLGGDFPLSVARNKLARVPPVKGPLRAGKQRWEVGHGKGVVRPQDDNRTWRRWVPGALYVIEFTIRHRKGRVRS